MRLSPTAADFLRSARVARLATADTSGRPHVVPICFAFDGRDLYSAIDRKPKKDAAPLSLKRIRNIQSNPRVCLVADRYAEDWRKLAYVLVAGAAEILTDGPRHKRALRLLEKKYPQYRRMALDGRPVIRIVPERATTWGAL